VFSSSLHEDRLWRLSSSSSSNGMAGSLFKDGASLVATAVLTNVESRLRLLSVRNAHG